MTGSSPVIATPHPKGERPPISFISVCSGVEAASQALIPLGGFKCVGVAEIEPHPCHVLAHRFGASRPINMPRPEDVPTHNADGSHRFPQAIAKDKRERAAAIKAVSKLPDKGEIPNYGDMSRFQEWPDADLDALFGGTPCQPFSVAGLREGLADPRGNLMLTFGAIAARIRPRWLLWENVPGVLSSNGGRDFASFLGLLSGQQIEPPPEGWQNSGIVPGIADAYGVAWRVLDAQHVRTRSKPRAVPQRRRRVFVVGYLGDWTRAAAVLFDAESLRRDPPPRREAGQGSARGIEFGPQGGGFSDVNPTLDTRAKDGPIRNQLAGAVLCADIAPTLRAMTHADSHQNGGGQLAVAYSIQAGAVRENPTSGPDGVGVQEGHAYTLEARQEVQAVAFDTTQITSPTNRSNPHPGDPCHTLAKGAHPPAVAFAENQRGELRLSDVSLQLTAGGGKPGEGYPAVMTPWAVRRLLPVECERLMGMEDDFTNVPWRGKDFSPDGNRYKELGNSWALNCIEWIGERMLIVDAWECTG